MTTDTALQRVLCEQLKIGMRVVELDRPWIESPFTVKGFRIGSEAELEQLRHSCNYVYVATASTSNNVFVSSTGSLTKAKPDNTPTANNLKRQHYSNHQSFQDALPQARDAHREAKTVVKSFFKNLRQGQSIDTSVAKKAIKQCVDSVIANQEAMIWLGLLKDVDEYTARHSLNVGLLSIILGRAEGLSPPDLEMVGLCGMLHDMGKAEIPLDILNKEGAFSDDEFEIMKSHTTKGYKILSEKADLIAEVANVAHSHHERLNGRGYPRGLPPEKITYFTRIVAIADTYDAITSKRIYSPAKSSLEGLRILIGAKGSHFDAHLVDSFVDSIGIYPAGSIAELSNGEIAIVLPSPIGQRNTPNVLVVRDRRKHLCAEKHLDLSQEITDDNDQLIKIKHLLSDNVFGIDISQYHQLGTSFSA